MKQKFLKIIYLKYRSFFYTFLAEEFLDELPKTVVEPAMTFLSTGKDKLEKWALFQAHFLQSRIVTDAKRIQTYEGMLLMLKLLLVHIKQPTRTIMQVGKPEEEKKDPVAEMEAAVTALKEKGKLSTT